MFAIVTLEREPPGARDVLDELVNRIQNVGGYAACILVLWLLVAYLMQPAHRRPSGPRWQSGFFLFTLIAAAVCYVPVLIFLARDLLVQMSGSTANRPPAPAWMSNVYSTFLTLGGIFALTAATLPFVLNVPALRWRRIGALARLTFKEAIRRRVLYAFSFLLLVFLFASWFVPYKPEDQVRTYVAVFNVAISWILLLVAVLVGAFSIPTDIRQQTIHTVLTKPTERFEVVVGRFLGFVGLMTLVLVVMTTFSLLFVLRSIDPAAAAESIKAREPLYGELHFENTPEKEKATNVGKEWDYRSYISGALQGQKPQIAVWDFASVPASLGNRQQVRCEFAFDIYRTTKGKENQGVPCEMIFQTGQFSRAQEEEYAKERRERLESGAGGSLSVENELAERFGYYVVPAKEVTDFHTLTVDVPAGLFKSAAKAPPGAPALQVRVICKSSTQYIGMAKGDLYFRMDDPSGRWDRLAFAWNYYKGAFGLWLRLCMIIGLAVAVSTYLSGVISLLVAGTLYGGGFFLNFIKTVAAGMQPGGGPLESLVRLANRQVSAAVPLDDTATSRFAVGGDNAFRWFIRRALDLIPDIDRFDLANYVAEGFNIPVLQMVYLFLLMGLYLAPWILLGYYLLKWREIAGPT